MSNKCPQCGFPEYMTGGECPKYLYGDGYSFGHRPSEPSLRLLVVDMGDNCIVNLETDSEGQLWAIRAFGALVPENYNHMPIICVPHSFEKIKNAIDAHFAESDRPVPRIETNLPCNPDVYFLITANNKPDEPEWLRDKMHTIYPHELDALNALARQAGAPHGLPIYEPRGTWTRLNTHDWTAARQSASEAGYGIDTHSYEDAICPIKIWRYER